MRRGTVPETWPKRPGIVRGCLSCRFSGAAGTETPPRPLVPLCEARVRRASRKARPSASVASSGASRAASANAARSRATHVRNNSPATSRQTMRPRSLRLRDTRNTGRSAAPWNSGSNSRSRNHTYGHEGNRRAKSAKLATVLSRWKSVRVLVVIAIPLSDDCLHALARCEGGILQGSLFELRFISELR